VLLGDLGGIAISAVRIAGVTHEFSTIPGVREYTWNIIKFKRNCCKKQNTRHWIRTVKSARPSVITADLIQLPSNLEIVNPNHYIATISTSNILEIEFKFEYGTGYRLAAQNILDEADNYLQLDTIFMPVQK
jgi:DNA-directed RNA polymerase subunit alpha